MASYSWRKATLDDLDTLVRRRREMFREMGHVHRLDEVASPAS